MTLNAKKIRYDLTSYYAHHKNILKKIDKMKSRCNIAADVLVNEITIGSDVIGTLFHVFKQSIEDSNEDKKYFMQKLRVLNEVKESLRDLLRELNDITIEVNNSNKNDKNYDEATIIDNTVKKLDRMTTAVNSLNSSLRSSREERKDEALSLLRSLNTNIIQAKTKLKQQKIIKPTLKKPDFARKKLLDRKK
jgi:hypothetical protein